METVQVLELLIRDAEGKSKKINVPEPTQDVTAELAQSTLEAIIASPILSANLYVEPIAARYVERTVNEIYTHE